MKKLFVGALVALVLAAGLLAQGPLTPIGQLRGRTDGAGALYTAAGTASGAPGPLTPIAQLRGRTDSNGNLLTTVAAGTMTPASLQPTAPAITAGSATGLTISNTGEVRTLVYKVNIGPTAFVCAAVTCDLTIGTLPNDNVWITNVTAQIVTVFACSATCTSTTLSLVLGKGAGGAEYLASFDADAATGTFGDADAELGTLMTRAAAIQGGTFFGGGSTQPLVVRLTSGTGNIGTGTVTNLSQGSLFIWVTTTRL